MVYTELQCLQLFVVTQNVNFFCRSIVIVFNWNYDHVRKSNKKSCQKTHVRQARKISTMRHIRFSFLLFCSFYLLFFFFSSVPRDLKISRFSTFNMDYYWKMTLNESRVFFFLRFEKQQKRLFYSFIQPLNKRELIVKENANKEPKNNPFE